MSYPQGKALAKKTEQLYLGGRKRHWPMADKRKVINYPENS